MAFRAGDRIKAKYLASSAGIKAPGGWFAGKIVKANADGTFNLRYDDGDSENAVLARYIKLDHCCISSLDVDELDASVEFTLGIDVENFHAMNVWMLSDEVRASRGSCMQVPMTGPNLSLPPLPHRCGSRCTTLA